MATWHQLQRPTKLYHDTKWTVVDDPPNDCRSLTLCDTEDEARALCARELAKGRHVYVLRPAKSTEDM